MAAWKGLLVLAPIGYWYLRCVLIIHFFVFSGLLHKNCLECQTAGEPIDSTEVSGQQENRIRWHQVEYPQLDGLGVPKGRGAEGQVDFLGVTTSRCTTVKL